MRPADPSSTPSLLTASDGGPLPVAFYAPMKAPDHPVPSGDRTIARRLLAALGAAGAAPLLASRLRVLDLEGDEAAQKRFMAEAAHEIARLVAAKAGGAALWLTYHSHYKSPDLIGPAVSRALGIPYAIVEPSISARRRDGAWAAFAAASERAIAAADRLFWTTDRDRPALLDAGHAARLAALPPFLDPGPTPPRLRASAGDPLQLLTVAMMRQGEKAESYRRLARGLRRLPGPWQFEIIGDGPLRGEIEALFAPFNGPLAGPEGGAVRFLGAREAPEVRRAMEMADLLVWPGVGEGVGMVWLEAGAAALPVVAEDGPAARTVVPAGPLAAPGDAHAFAAAIAEAAADRPALSQTARARVLAHHTIAAGASVLARHLGAILRERAGAPLAGAS
ncbi:MAG: glycosyltransferase [Pseudomonadota bacterium]